MNSFILTCQECGAKNRIPADKQHIPSTCGKCKTSLNVQGHAVPVELGDHNFQSFIQAASLPLVVDFYSPTCGPCQALAPVIQKLASKYLSRAIIAKLDTSKHPGTAGHYQIRGVPTLIFFHNGAVINQTVGALPEPEICRKLDQLL